MTGLQYHPGWHEARARLAAWWNGEDIGRAVVQVSAPRAEPWERIPPVPQPEGWVTHYSTKSLPYRVYVALASAASREYFGEAAPWAAVGDLAPNCLALYLGCPGVEMPGTVWCEPCMETPEEARFEYDPDSFYWKFSLDAHRALSAVGRGKLLHQFPDLIEGLDTLAAMRGNEELLVDLIERPEWVQACLRRITDLYFRYYDVLYDRIRDDVGGSVFWAWAPGRLVKLQCDFSAMISPAMFREFMVPVLAEMTERTSYSMYHWDGPGALAHEDALLSLPRLDMIQWTPGAGAEPTWHPCWWPMYHRVLDAGKKLFLHGGNRETLLALRREFGRQSKHMLINCAAPNAQEAEGMVQAMEL